MNSRAPEEIENEAMVYWRRRLADEQADVERDPDLPPRVRGVLIAELGKTIVYLDRIIDRRKEVTAS